MPDHKSQAIEDMENSRFALAPDATDGPWVIEYREHVDKEGVRWIGTFLKPRETK